jgi:hypothetical protein
MFPVMLSGIGQRDLTDILGLNLPRGNLGMGMDHTMTDHHHQQMMNQQQHMGYSVGNNFAPLQLQFSRPDTTPPHHMVRNKSTCIMHSENSGYYSIFIITSRLFHFIPYPI